MLAVNLVGMSLDDVVIVMSIPRRLVLTIRSHVNSSGTRVWALTRRATLEGRPPVVVLKKVIFFSLMVSDLVLGSVGDEVLAVNLVDVSRMSLDDVVIVMSIPRRLVLTIRSRVHSSGTRVRELTRRPKQEGSLPVVVLKKETVDDRSNGENSENGHLIRARTKGLPPEIPAIAVKLSEKDHQRERKRYEQPHCPPPEYGRSLGASASPKIAHHHHPYHHPPPTHQQYTASRRREEPLQSTPRWVVTEQPKVVPYHSSTYQDSYESSHHQPSKSYQDHQHTPKSYPDPYDTSHQNTYQDPLSYDQQKSYQDSLSRQHTTKTYPDPYESTRHQDPSRTYERQPGSYDYGSYDGYDNKGYEAPRYEAHHRRTRSMVPPSRGGAGYYDIAAATPLRRSTGMLRSECSGLEDYHTSSRQRDEYRRRSFRVSPTVQHRGRVRRYGGGATDGGILRRRGDFLESASDTEAQQESCWTMGKRRGAAQYGGRSHSLPRCLRSGGFGGGRQHHQAVRFTTYDSQEESDGAVSAPELPATRSLRRPTPSSGPTRNGGVFTSNEYRAWMSRAPSTSAIYERLRRGQQQQRTPGLGRVAYSAESLLDTVRQEEYRGIYTFPRRLHTPCSEDGASSLPGGRTRPHSVVPHPTPVKPSEDRLHLVSLDPRDFNKYRARPTITPVTSLPGPTKGHSGLLWVHLLSGRGLRGPGTPNGDPFRDLYCVIEVDRVHKARTVVRTGEHSFDWDEIFEIDLVENREVAFLLYTWDPRFRHKLCYKGVLHLSALLRESPVHSLALKLEPRGTLYLKMRHKGPAHTFQRMPSTALEGVFGVDIETVLVREDSGFGVPLIVKRCTEEVERRGLDIVGIYRLCGSALRKRILRDEFERSALTADLSVEHVPDINVVTSLLKDYLRELPEPLLSRSLYEMLVDGLSVCLPDDPEGSAKLMFSILECLPKSNLCTVLLLLDHLRLVASHCDRNKMAAQALATAFGPALMCHADGPSSTVDIRRPIDVVTFLVDMWPDKRSPRLWFDATSNEVYRM
ncbi:hypothetical protein JTE90_003240 [Oedothorax gibbosus]|uniref:Rho GTPase-activating protein 100F n=1 Tax=Oedothorax gibbosus TaxID=931172 RepID=A0AAV6UQZ6_9ARAC|nr:hypothetical protein JTE90_003240 [Oedothorax gibbosus]